MVAESKTIHNNGKLVQPQFKYQKGKSITLISILVGSGAGYYAYSVDNETGDARMRRSSLYGVGSMLVTGTFLSALSNKKDKKSLPIKKGQEEKWVRKYNKINRKNLIYFNTLKNGEIVLVPKNEYPELENFIAQCNNELAYLNGNQLEWNNLKNSDNLLSSPYREYGIPQLDLIKEILPEKKRLTAYPELKRKFNNQFENIQSSQQQLTKLSSFLSKEQKITQYLSTPQLQEFDKEIRTKIDDVLGDLLFNAQNEIEAFKGYLGFKDLIKYERDFKDKYSKYSDYEWVRLTQDYMTSYKNLLFKEHAYEIVETIELKLNSRAVTTMTLNEILDEEEMWNDFAELDHGNHLEIMDNFFLEIKTSIASTIEKRETPLN